jgi:Cu(I)/Ag(I) efflux system protein CusF
MRLSPLQCVVLAVSLTAPATLWAQSGNMKGMETAEKKPADAGKPGDVHKAIGTVKSVDRAAGRVTIAHGPVRTLKWPAMTMRFGVRDKALFDRLSPGAGIKFEFVQEGRDYVIVSAK